MTRPLRNAKNYLNKLYNTFLPFWRWPPFNRISTSILVFRRAGGRTKASCSWGWTTYLFTRGFRTSSYGKEQYWEELWFGFGIKTCSKKFLISQYCFNVHTLCPKHNCITIHKNCVTRSKFKRTRREGATVEYGASFVHTSQWTRLLFNGLVWYNLADSFVSILLCIALCLKINYFSNNQV